MKIRFLCFIFLASISTASANNGRLRTKCGLAWVQVNTGRILIKCNDSSYWAGSGGPGIIKIFSASYDQKNAEQMLTVLKAARQYNKDVTVTIQTRTRFNPRNCEENCRRLVHVSF